MSCTRPANKGSICLLSSHPGNLNQQWGNEKETYQKIELIELCSFSCKMTLTTEEELLENLLVSQGE